MILKSLVDKRKNNQKSLSVLIDPDKIENEASLKALIIICKNIDVDYIFVGGSLIVNDTLNETVSFVKNNSNIPVVLFPGSNLHIDKAADAILFLSLISGRNPDLLIGQHVAAAPILKNSTLEIIPTGYILIDGGTNSSVLKVSKTIPIPQKNIELAVSTAVAGMYKGKQLIYLEAGSGAKNVVNTQLISEVKKNITIPLIVGGGIRSKEQLNNAYHSGADLVVIGTAFENKLDL